jgi:hypothetical protein
MRYIEAMKSAHLPSVRIEPELRSALESVLQPDETLSEFVETSVRQALQQRTLQAEFVVRGLASLQAARQNQDLVEAQDLLDTLQARLAKARTRRVSSQA